MQDLKTLDKPEKFQYFDYLAQLEHHKEACCIDLYRELSEIETLSLNRKAEFLHQHP